MLTIGNVNSEMLNKNRLFLRVYKLKDKFRYLIKQNPEKKTALRELFSCIVQKFNGFSIVCVKFSKKLWQPFCPIDLIYKPVKKCDYIIDCFFNKNLNLVFKVSYSEGQRIKRSTA